MKWKVALLVLIAIASMGASWRTRLLVRRPAIPSGSTSSPPAATSGSTSSQWDIMAWDTGVWG